MEKLSLAKRLAEGKAKDKIVIDRLTKKWNEITKLHTGNQLEQVFERMFDTILEEMEHEFIEDSPEQFVGTMYKKKETPYFIDMDYRGER